LDEIFNKKGKPSVETHNGAISHTLQDKINKDYGIESLALKRSASDIVNAKEESPLFQSIPLKKSYSTTAFDSMPLQSGLQSLKLPSFSHRVSKRSKFKHISRVLSSVMSLKKMKVERNGNIVEVNTKHNEIKNGFGNGYTLVGKDVLVKADVKYLQNISNKDKNVENWDMDLADIVLEKRRQIINENRNQFESVKTFKDEYDLKYDEGKHKKKRKKKEIRHNNFQKTQDYLVRVNKRNNNNE